MSKIRVLVVDDNRAAADTLALFFKLDGYEAACAYDGAEAVAAVRGGQFDLVMMDIGMPELDGCEAARRMGALTLEKAPILVALSGWSQPQDLQRTKEAGFTRHLVKPVEPNELRTVLEDLGLRQESA